MATPPRSLALLNQKPGFRKIGKNPFFRASVLLHRYQVSLDPVQIIIADRQDTYFSNYPTILAPLLLSLPGPRNALFHVGGPLGKNLIHVYIRLYAHTYGTVVVVAWPEGQSLAMHGTRVLNLVLEYGTSTRHACMHARSRVTSESILCFYM